MIDSCIYLDTYILQQDMRVRMPKAILSNMGVEKGKTKFDIYLDSREHIPFRQKYGDASSDCPRAEKPERRCVLFVERYEKTKTRVEELHSIKNARQAQADAFGAFMFEVQELDAPADFDEKLWLTIIDTVTVHADGRMTFKFQGGTEIDA